MKYSYLLTHFAAAVIITGIMLTVYATVQQAHRMGVNDPQLQLASMGGMYGCNRIAFYFSVVDSK